MTLEKNPKRIAITGAHGVVGWHLAVALFSQGHHVVRLGRPELVDAQTLASHLAGVDCLVHCAGVNRGSDEAVTAGNIELATVVAAAVSLLPSIDVVNVNSLQSRFDNVYGQSKKMAGEIVRKACDASGHRFVDVITPNVFGEYGRPSYNSFVATFAHAVATGNRPTSVVDRPLPLIHVQDLADVLIDAIHDLTSNVVDPPAHQTSVQEVLNRFDAMHESYQRAIFPAASDPFDLALFNTYRSYLYPDKYPTPFVKNVDNRGHLVETVKTNDKGQAFVSTTKPGITRGNHFHRRKIERFLVLAGTAEIQIRKVFSDEIRTFRVTGDEPCAIDIPTLHTHNITNVGSDGLITFFWTNEIFDPQNPDTYALPVNNSAPRADLDKVVPA